MEAWITSLTLAEGYALIFIIGTTAGALVAKLILR